MVKLLKFIGVLLETINSEYKILFKSNISPPLKLIQGFFFLCCLQILSLTLRILEMIDLLFLVVKKLSKT